MEKKLYKIFEKHLITESIKKILLEKYNREQIDFFEEKSNESELSIYNISEILSCPTSSLYKRKNYISIKEFEGIIKKVNREAISNYFNNILNSIDLESEHNINYIYEHSNNSNEYNILYNIDHIVNNSIYYIKVINNLNSLKFSHVWLNEFDNINNFENGYPIYKPRNTDINQFAFVLALANINLSFKNYIICIYIPLSTQYNKEKNKYLDNILVFRTTFGTDIQERAKELIFRKFDRYNYANFNYDKGEIPSIKDLERIPSIICKFPIKYGGCQLKKQVKTKENKKEIVYTCALKNRDLEEEIKIKSKKIFPLFFPYIKNTDINIYKKEITELWNNYINSKLFQINIPQEVIMLFEKELSLFLNTLFIKKHNNYSIYYLRYVILNKIINDIQKYISKEIATKIITELDSKEFKSQLFEYLEKRFSPLNFVVDQSSIDSFNILSNIYKHVLLSDIYYRFSEYFIGECPRRVKNIRDGIFYKDIRINLLNDEKGLAMIPQILKTEFRVNLINLALTQFYSNLITDNIFRNIKYRKFSIKYFLGAKEKLNLDYDYPIIFCFSQSLYNLEKEFNENEIDIKIKEGTGKYNYKKSNIFLIPCKKDIIRALVLKKALVDNNKIDINMPILLIYLPRKSYNDIRAFLVYTTDNNLDFIDNIIDNFNNNINNNIPYTYEEFKQNELRCFYCPYSYLNYGEKSTAPFCKEGQKMRKRYIEELKESL